MPQKVVGPATISQPLPNPIEEVLIADQCVFVQGASKPPVTLYYGYHDTKVRPALVNVSPVIDISGETIYAMNLVAPGALSLFLCTSRGMMRLTGLPFLSANPFVHEEILSCSFEGVVRPIRIRMQLAPLCAGRSCVGCALLALL